MNKAKPEDINMSLVGFRITRILTKYTQKLPAWSLHQIDFALP